jgi:pimeloyl-ACP methyl ester carboxylesterase
VIANGEVIVGGRHLETGWIGPRPSQAPSIVLLHEGLGCLSLWRGFPEQLAKCTGLGVFSFSRLGYGGSDPAPLPRPLTYLDDEAATTLPAVLDAAGIRDFILLGHSDGGSIAAVFAGLHADERLRGVVLIAPHVIIEEVTVAGVWRAAAAFEQGDLRARLMRHHGDNTDIAFRDWRDLQLHPAFRAWTADRALDHIRVPVLMIQGDADAYGSREQVRRLQARRPESEVLLLPGCGHAPHLEREEDVLTAVAAFARRTLPHLVGSASNDARCPTADPLESG